jgi:transcriptional regulator with GAF, ATPase, and Fis domain
VEPSLALPARYEALGQLGAGGGGEVWAVRDRQTHSRLALKVLSEGASEHEMAALVREAVALSGLEGLGVPRVVRFGRLPGSGRPYLVREMVEGQSLEQLMHGGAPSERILSALATAAEQLTLVHRAGFFHGDIKPANIIVADDGRATLVDLGLSAPWREQGAHASGLTPKYAAPELLAGGPLTVRAEIYALGVALRDTVERGEQSLDADRIAALLTVAQRATSVEPGLRHPSADEFATALRSAARLEAVHQQYDFSMTWPIVGIDSTASRLHQLVLSLEPGRLLALRGKSGAGKSVLLRRLAWSLGVEGRSLVWLDAGAEARDVELELAAHGHETSTLVLVDDAAALDPAAASALRAALPRGALIVAVGSLAGRDADQVFQVPPLAEHVATDLLKRAIPSLTEAAISKLYRAADGRPGELRRFVALLAHKAVASEEDIESLVFGERDTRDSVPPGDPLPRALALLARGRYSAAREALDEVALGDPLIIAVARARLSVGLGDARGAFAALEGVRADAEARTGSPEQKAWTVWLARAHISLAEYQKALELLALVRDEPGSLGAEALAFEGLALTHLDDQEAAKRALEQAIDTAREAADPRVQAVALTGLGLVLQRGDELEQAEQVYNRAVACAQTAGDASTLGTVQLNLAVLLKIKGDIARAIEHFEAAVDMGRRSGRRATVRIALLQLANMDLDLGRLARARSSIDALLEQQNTLPPSQAAQLTGLEAMLYARTGELQKSVEAYRRCAAAFEAIGSGVDGAEARLEGVLAATQVEPVDPPALHTEIERAKGQLGDGAAHRHLVLLAEARVLLAAGREPEAREALDQGLLAAKESHQRDWVWRILAARAELEEAAGQKLMARRDRVEAVTVLEEIGARLPRDLREVFWNDRPRKDLRAQVEQSIGHAQTQFAPVAFDLSSISSPISAFTQTPLEQRLARLLEINRDLLGELDLDKLTAKVVEGAVDLVRAERGFVILADASGELTVHSSSARPGDEEHERFSRSIAEEVIETREPIVTKSARNDARMLGYQSVHQMAIESVACVPITARLQRPIGALYVETRRRPGRDFEREIPTLRAFADQVALAIETARLINENKRRADELSELNVALEKAQQRLKETLGERTERLRETRKKLRETRDTLYGHFGYQGAVGRSDAMRHCFELIERVKETDVPVLITGESGTGKEVLARAIHRGSNRAKMPFLGVNCGAIPEHLLESELFGHVRGAFTGADRDRKGLLRDAKAGTVLLDEIGEMPHKMQAGLLRVLQERKVRPVGGSEEEAIDCRFLFATHRNLERLVKENRFREDLYYRINVVEIPLPSLRERIDDIPLLVDHFLGIFAARYKRDRRSLTREALNKLCTYDWPGNVRQLEHVLLNAWIMSDEPEVDTEDIDLPTVSFEAEAPAAGSPSAPAPAAHVAPDSNKNQSLSSHRRSERERIIEALEACNWNRVKAAELSGIPRRTFYRRLREYKIQ